MDLIRSLAVWLLLMVAESVHGALRTVFLQPLVGDFRARQIGAVVGAALILVVVCLLIRWIGATSRRQLLGIGLLWLVLTLSFEVGLGRLAGLSWERIGSDYDILHGGLLPGGMLVLAVSPLLAARWRGVGRKDE